MGDGGEPEALVVVELLVSKDGSDAVRDLRRDRSGGVVDAWSEGVGAMVEHELGEVLGSSLDAEILEHGVGLPTPKELDVFLVYACTEEGGCATRAERAGAEEPGRDASGRFEQGGGMAKGVGHKGWLYGVPASVTSVSVEVKVDRVLRGGIVDAEVSRNATEGLGRTEEGVVVGAVADLFAAHSILLVKERQRSMGDALDSVPVIQRC